MGILWKNCVRLLTVICFSYSTRKYGQVQSAVVSIPARIWFYSIFRRNSRVRSSFGARKKVCGSPCSTMTPFSIKMTLVAASRANAISCVTTIMVMRSAARARMVRSTSPVSSGSSAEVGSSKSMMSGFMASARAMATRCCCPPESWLG